MQDKFLSRKFKFFLLLPRVYIQSVSPTVPIRSIPLQNHHLGVQPGLFRPRLFPATVWPPPSYFTGMLTGPAMCNYTQSFALKRRGVGVL